VCCAAADAPPTRSTFARNTVTVSRLPERVDGGRAAWPLAPGYSRPPYEDVKKSPWLLASAACTCYEIVADASAGALSSAFV